VDTSGKKSKLSRLLVGLDLTSLHFGANFYSESRGCLENQTCSPYDCRFVINLRAPFSAHHLFGVSPVWRIPGLVWPNDNCWGYRQIAQRGV